MKANKLTLLALGLWALTVVVFAVMMFRGNPVDSTDDRIALGLKPEDRAIVHQGMTNFFGRVTELNLALAEGKTDQVAEIASKAGGAALANIPSRVMLQLPVDFKKAGFVVHGQFDDLAEQARAGAEAPQIQRGLVAILKNCSDCHTRYKVVEQTP
ncbi:MAG: hypothetical protein RRB13_15735 [bacterium]|nr:hypothetical protein [bacterium]